MTDVVSYEVEDGIAVITVDNPPVNALSHAVRAGITAAVDRAASDADVTALALVCAGRTFIAGADITEFGKPPQAPSLRDQNAVQESCPKPMVAGIHGTALGGGLETAFACHYRVALATARVGLPEVKLGIVPGAGGTQRLPRLTGAEKAIAMICGGDPIGAEEAASLGIVDRIVTGDLRAATAAFAREIVASGAALSRVRDRSDRISGVDSTVFETARAEWARKKRGFEAPQACIDAIEAACTLPFDDGMARERALFDTLVSGDQSRAQRHVFFAERQATKIPDVPKDTPRRRIRNAAVIGAGTMGTGIAMNFANAGMPCVIVEQDAEALARGLDTIRANYEASAKRGRLTPEEVEARMARLIGSVDLEDVAESDIIIEAVFENMEIKTALFARLDRICRDGAILATNTSTLDVDRIAGATSRPGDVIGLHFFSPANVMRLLEAVRGAETAPEVIATCMDLAKRIGKVPVLVGVCHGFVGNRMLHAYMDQAYALLHEGCLPEDVDRALRVFGLAMGPFAMSDLAGLDVGWRIRQEQGRTNPIADRLCEMGRFGQKTGAGFYRYAPGSRTPEPDPGVTAIVEEEGRRTHPDRRTIADKEIVARCMLALVNEGARILDEGVALRASDIDVVYVFGYGFPAWRGGPMFWADLMGLNHVRDEIARFHAAGLGAVWEPAALLERLADSGSTFAAHDAG